MKIVEVTWKDSTTYDAWQHESGMISKVATCKTVGYLYSKTKNKVVLVASKSIGTVAQMMVIPRKCIKKIRKL